MQEGKHRAKELGTRCVCSLLDQPQEQRLRRSWKIIVGWEWVRQYGDGGSGVMKIDAISWRCMVE